ncbi:MAG: DUF1254 domain-containing protein [Bacteroidales bacterium]|nr:DUF1254 domain-containing protein [Bacteroidales bacterium]
MDKNSPDYAGGFNRFKNYTKMFTYEDTTIVSPNNDTPYSWGILDLSDEPVILEVPAIPADRYYVMQLIDLYTYNFAYVGSRSTGNGAGRYLIAGPDWKGNKPAGVDSVFRCETNLVCILGRTELKNENDMPTVEKIQKQYNLMPLHEFSGIQTPTHKSYKLPLPVWSEPDYMNVSFINILNILLQYTSMHPSEKELRSRFARIGIIPGQPLDTTLYSKEVLEAIREGIKDGKTALKDSIAHIENSMNLFGTRSDLRNDYLARATAAAVGIYGNTKEEAVYVGGSNDIDNHPLTGDKKYILHFTKGQIPHVEYFWSITIYNLPNRSLVQNPIDRYSIGDRSEDLKYNADGSLDIYLQSVSPGKAKEGNWLPVPAQGPFNCIIRLYGPGTDITNGTWQQPFPKEVK